MKQIFTKLVFASLFVVLGFFANAQSLEELMQEGDNYYKEFNHQNVIEIPLSHAHLRDKMNVQAERIPQS